MITELELKALRATDHGARLRMGRSLLGEVWVSADGVVTVRVTWRFKVAGKLREKRVGIWGGKDGVSLKTLFTRRDDMAASLRKDGDPIAQREAERQKAQQDAEAKKLAAVLAAQAAIEEAERVAELARIKAEANHQQAMLEQQQRLQELAALQARMTVRELFAHWQRLELVRRADKGAEAERSFAADVFPLIGGMAAQDVGKPHIQEVMDTIKVRATPKNDMVRTAKKTLADLRQMFGFALDRDYIQQDPTARMKKASIGKDKERERVLSEPELIELFQKLPHAGMADTSRLALVLQLSTLARIGEVLTAQWKHVDLNRRTWLLPETKNDKAHTIHLNDVAVQAFTELNALTGLTPWLFPAARDLGNHVCEKTVTKQVSDRQKPDGKPMSGRSKHVDALVLPGGKWTPHDLRRTGATMMAELGTLPDVVERCLNHVEQNKIKRIYQRATYEGAMREAWQVLGQRLALLRAQAEGKADNVVTLHKAA